MPWTTASQTHRSLRCQASVYLAPKDKKPLSPKAKKAADKGTEIHEFIYSVHSGTKTIEEALAKLTLRSAKVVCKNLAVNSHFWEFLKKHGFSSNEQSFAFNCLDKSRVVYPEFLSREARDGLHSDLWLVTGTADLVASNRCLPERVRHVVVDIKTGKWAVKAKLNYQYLTCAVGLFGTDEPVEIGTLTIDNKGLFSYSYYVVSVELLKKHERRLVNAYKRLVKKHQPELNSYCRFCPARNNCPEWNKKQEFKNDNEEYDEDQEEHEFAD